jgi:hypothetical protein
MMISTPFIAGYVEYIFTASSVFPCVYGGKGRQIWKVVVKLSNKQPGYPRA